ncbi:MAG: hypothetical protein ACRC7S_09845 [Cetobacterium sp.]
MEATKHAKERAYRLKDGEKKIERIFELSRNGRQFLHIMLSDATVMIVDKERNKIVTYLNCRPNQVLKYYEAVGEATPIHLLQHANVNVSKKLNY